MMIKKIRYKTEALILKLFFFILSLFSLKVSSEIGAILAKTIGPKLRSHNTAKKNFNFVFSSMTKLERDKYLLDMWENFGRTIAEYPFLCEYINNNRVTIEGQRILKELSNTNAIIFSGHFANWEVMATIVSNIADLALVYRAPNNPYVDEMLRSYRNTISLQQIPKGPLGAKAIVKTLKKGTILGMLVDQKQNDGLSVPFFGKEAMSPSAIAKLSLKYNLPIIPVSIIREKKINFKLIIHEKIEIDYNNDNVLTVMLKVNNFLENSIKKNPSQWLWMHKRWKQD